MKNKITLIILIGFSFFCNLQAQVTQEWVQRYNGAANSSDIGRAMVFDNYGNLYVTGASIVNSGSSWDVCTIKYNSSGVQQWIAVYAGPRSIEDGAYSIAVDISGNVYVTGSVDGHTNYEDYITIKYNSMGVQQWAVRYNGPDNYSDEAYSIAVDIAGNAYVTGRCVSNGRNDYCTIKYSTYGDQLWVVRYDGPLHLNDQPYQLKIDLANNVYVTGGIDELSANSKNFGTVKYNSSGVQQWAAIYNGTANNSDDARSLAIDNSGNVYVTGESKGIGSDYDIATIKYDANGSQIWSARYNGTENYLDCGNSIAVSQQGDIYVGGWSYGSGTLSDFVTIKYNPSGIQQWERRYNGPGDSLDYTTQPNSLSLDSSGNAYITGGSKGINSDYDYCTIKYSSSGDQIWLQRYNGPGNKSDFGVVVAVNNLNNTYVFGSSAGSTINDFCLIKYSQPTGITPISEKIPGKFNLSQNYPNPFNPTTKIRFDVPLAGAQYIEPVQLRIYDVLGREVTTLVNEQLQPGTYEIEWDATNYPSGVYYYKLTVGDYTQTKKMILLK